MHINQRKYSNCEHKKIIFNFNTTTSDKTYAKINLNSANFLIRRERNNYSFVNQAMIIIQ